MSLENVTQTVRDAATVRTVFGDPYQVDGLTVIPVARTGGGLFAWRSVAKARHRRKALQAKYRE